MTSERINQSGVLETVLKSDEELIKKTRENVDDKIFEHAVDMILNARKIYVIGIHSCAPLAQFLYFYLNLIFSDVVLVHTNNTSEVFEQMLRIDENDVIIGISFPRYSMMTVKALEFANRRRAGIIPLTDSIYSPVNLYSSCNLIANSGMASIVDSLVAPLSLINALILALCMNKKDDVAESMKLLENIWDEYNVFEKDDIEPVSDKVILPIGGKEE